MATTGCTSFAVSALSEKKTHLILSALHHVALTARARRDRMAELMTPKRMWSSVSSNSASARLVLAADRDVGRFCGSSAWTAAAHAPSARERSAGIAAKARCAICMLDEAALFGTELTGMYLTSMGQRHNNHAYSPRPQPHLGRSRPSARSFSHWRATPSSALLHSSVSSAASFTPALALAIAQPSPAARSISTSVGRGRGGDGGGRGGNKVEATHEVGGGGRRYC